MHDEIIADFHKVIADLIVARRANRNVIVFIDELAQARERFQRRLQQMRYENPNLAAECSLCGKSILKAANDAMHRARETGRVSRDFARENKAPDNISSFYGTNLTYTPHSTLGRTAFKSIARQRERPRNIGGAKR